MSIFGYFFTTIRSKLLSSRIAYYWTPVLPNNISFTLKFELLELKTFEIAKQCIVSSFDRAGK